MPLRTLSPAAPVALVVGNGRHRLRSVIRLLVRAGFTCDCITGDPRLAASPLVREAIALGPGHGWLDDAIAWIGRTGGIVVPCEDWRLRVIRDSPLDDAAKCRLLPITGPEHLGHVGSKVGLARALEAGGILAPRFAEARSASDLPSACDAIGYPLLVKVDESAGGEGIRRCRSADEVAAIARQFPDGSFLVQEWIEGVTVDLSGFFQGGRPVHFVHAEFLATSAGPFSPSRVRRYTHPSCLPEELFATMADVGQVLGLDGFVNLTAIRGAEDGRLRFVEADLRPNAWVESTRLIGDDPAEPIRLAFAGTSAGVTSAGVTGQVWPRPRPAGVPSTVDLPYPFRMRFLELLCNRYGVWRTFGEHDPVDLFSYAAERVGLLLRSVVRGSRACVGRSRSADPSLRRAGP